MDTQQLINHARRLAREIRQAPSSSQTTGLMVAGCELLRAYAGPQSHFFQSVRHLSATDSGWAPDVASVLDSFASYLAAGLLQEIPPQRRAQLDMVSDLMELAQSLLEDDEVHPAAPAMVAGATLEEFLRTWAESEGLQCGAQKPGLNTYAQLLRSADLITKQDVKDITAWAGIRNHSAHGEWADVDSRERVAMMVDGINLFMRQCGA